MHCPNESGSLVRASTIFACITIFPGVAAKHLQKKMVMIECTQKPTMEISPSVSAPRMYTVAKKMLPMMAQSMSHASNFHR